MERDEFSTYLTSNIDIDEQAISLLPNSCKTITLKKGDFALREGETCKHTFFIESGLLKQYTLDNKGKEHILLFAPENWFVANIESVHFNRPSNYFIEAVEDTRILLVDEELILRLSQYSRTFLEFNNKLLHSHILSLQTRVTQLLAASAEERYLDFIKSYPQLVMRVPQWMIAAYLGIAPESLSRVRGELTERNYRSREA